MRGIWERFACISRRRSTDSGRASREEKNHLGGYPETKGKRLSVFLPPLQLRFVQSSALAGNRGVFAMSSHPFRVRTRNTRINMKFHRRNTGALPPSLSLSRGERRKEEAARHRWWLCILEGGRGKIPRFTKNRAGGMAIERERRKESRLLGSRFGLRTRVARDRSSEYISIRDSYRLIPPPPRLYFGSSRIGVRI